MFRLFGLFLAGLVLAGIADTEGAWAGNWNKSNNQTKAPYEFIENAPVDDVSEFSNVLILLMN